MSTDIGLAVLLAKLNQMGSGGGSSTPVGAMMDFAASVTTIPDKWAPCNGDTLTRGILRGKRMGLILITQKQQPFSHMTLRLSLASLNQHSLILLGRVSK
jgi:hypothetical protein